MDRPTKKKWRISFRMDPVEKRLHQDLFNCSDSESLSMLNSNSTASPISTPNVCNNNTSNENPQSNNTVLAVSPASRTNESPPSKGKVSNTNSNTNGNTSPSRSITMARKKPSSSNRRNSVVDVRDLKVLHFEEGKAEQPSTSQENLEETHVVSSFSMSTSSSSKLKGGDPGVKAKKHRTRSLNSNRYSVSITGTRSSTTGSSSMSSTHLDIAHLKNSPRTTTSTSTSVDTTPPLPLRASQSKSTKKSTPIPKYSERFLFILNEIISTELNYSSNLKTLKELFMEPLIKSDLLTDREASIIFSPLFSDICDSSQNLYQNLENVKKKLGKSRLGIGNIFLEMLSDTFTQGYTIYIIKFSKSQTLFHQLINERSQLAKYIRATEKKPECKLHTIQDLLISVVQRIPQYITLLNDLMNATEDVKEHVQINKSVTRLKDIADNINKKKKEIENMKKLKKIHKECGIKDIPEKRVLLYEDTIFETSPQKTEKEKEKEKEKDKDKDKDEAKFVRLYLFSDEVWLVKCKANAVQKVKRLPLTVQFSPSESSFKLGKTTYYCSNNVKLANLISQLNQILEK